MEKNLELELLPSGARALLPRDHLADSADNILLLWTALQPGDSLDCVMLLKQTNVAVSFLTNSKYGYAFTGLNF
jgi:hypothetical protein